MKKIFVSIIDYNGRENTLFCLDSLQKINKKGFEVHVVVIDNYPPKILKIPENYFKGLSLTLTKNKNNLGFSGGHNVGFSHALSKGADCVLLLNNDVIAHENFLINLFNILENDESIGMVSPKIYFAKGFEFHKDRYRREDLGKVFWYAGGILDTKNVIAKHRGVDEVDKGQFDAVQETDFATGACFLIKKSVLEKVGFFDEKYFLYYEDSDLSMRVRNKGFKIFYVPKAVLWHKNAASAGGSGSLLQDYYITRNRLLFGMKYAPLNAKLSLVRESLALLRKGRVWQKRGILDFYLRRFGKGSFPI